MVLGHMLTLVSTNQLVCDVWALSHQDVKVINGLGLGLVQNLSDHIGVWDVHGGGDLICQGLELLAGGRGGLVSVAIAYST